MEIVNRDRSAPFITKDGYEIRSILDRTNTTATNQSLEGDRREVGPGDGVLIPPGTRQRKRIPNIGNRSQPGEDSRAEAEYKWTFCKWASIFVRPGAARARGTD